MTDSYDMDAATLEEEVEKRVERVLADLGEADRYDLTNESVDDLDQREVLQRIVTAEVYGEFERETKLQEDTEPIEEPDLGERFEYVRPLGKGGQAHTVLAIDSESGERVAVKELAIGKLNDWKALEMFEREADVLRSLDHPAIPDYVHSFHIDDPIGRRFLIAQEYVEGSDLEQRLKKGARWNEQKAMHVMRSVLHILHYLHNLNPPVIHRDIKPSNIIERPDGSYALVDFGAVQHVTPKTIGGSTIAGTAGYMPLEQVMGRSVPATDLYALGATVVHLMARKHPAEMPMMRSRLQFDSYVQCSNTFSDLLNDLLHPNVEDRPNSVEQVVHRLLRAAKRPAEPRSLQSSRPTSSSSSGALVVAPSGSHQVVWLNGPQRDLHTHAQRSVEIAVSNPPAGVTWTHSTNGKLWMFQGSNIRLRQDDGLRVEGLDFEANLDLVVIGSVVALMVVVPLAFNSPILFVGLSALLLFAYVTTIAIRKVNELTIEGTTIRLTGKQNRSLPVHKVLMFETRSHRDGHGVFMKYRPEDDSFLTKSDQLVAKNLDVTRATLFAELLNLGLFNALARVGEVTQSQALLAHVDTAARLVVEKTYGGIAGCLVTEGAVRPMMSARLIRGGNLLTKSNIEVLRRDDRAVDVVTEGEQCRITLANWDDIRSDDVIEVLSAE